MAENYGSLEGVLDANETLEGEIDSHDEMSGEIQFSGGVGGVKDVQVNNESVVDANKVAHIDLTPYAEKEDVYDKQTIDTALEGKADTDDIPTALSQLDNDDNYVQDADYHHTDNNFTNEDKAAIGNIPENITDLSDVAVDNIQNGQVLKWDATQEKFVNADESGGGSGDVADVKVNGTSVVDPATKEANIDLTGYAETSDIPTDLADLSDDATHRLVTDTEKSTWDNKSDFSGSYNDLTDKPTIPDAQIQSDWEQSDNTKVDFIKNKPTLGTASAKDSTNAVTQGSTDLVESGAVWSAIDNLPEPMIFKGTLGTGGTITTLPTASSNNNGYTYKVIEDGTYDGKSAKVGDVFTSNATEWVLIPSGDETFTDTWRSVKVNGTELLGSSITTGAVNFKSGTNVTVSGSGNDITITAQDTTYSKATAQADGLMSKEDFSKLAGIASGAEVNVQANWDESNSSSDAYIQNKPQNLVQDASYVHTDNNYTTAEKNKVATIDNKADKVSGATDGHIAGLDANGNLTDSGLAATTIVHKADKVSGQVAGHLASLSGTGNLADSGWNGAKDTTSISGNPISISGLKANQLAKNPIITLEPIQAGSGTPSPSNIRAISGYDKIEILSCEKNLITLVKANTAVNGNGEEYANDSCCLSNAFNIVQGVSYSVSWQNKTGDLIAHKYNNNTYIGYVRLNDVKIFTFNDCNLVKLQWNGSVGSGSLLPTNPLADETNKTTDLSESLGQTVYGGSLDVRSGIFTKIWGYIASYAGETLPGEWISDRDEYVSGTTPTTGAEVAYKLASANYTTIQLTPHEISLLKDYAYVSTNGTNIALDYHNGELASLSDVSQLGETVNEGLDYLKGYVEKNKYGSWVDLSPYNAANNAYVFPSDGYVQVSSESVSNDTVRVVITSSDGTPMASIYMVITGQYQIQSVFVRKGMKAYIIRDVSGTAKRFYSLK